MTHLDCGTIFQSSQPFPIYTIYTVDERNRDYSLCSIEIEHVHCHCVGACYTESLRRRAETEHGLAFKKYWITVEACIKQTETDCTNEPWHFILLFLLLYAEADQHHRAFNNNIRLQSAYYSSYLYFSYFFLIVLLRLPCLFTRSAVMFHY